ncbi:MAG: hypothetical protein LBM93_06565 [Oscillospiraceae bacterium]|jgi:hypothetical protein|nr:hypothetical protein [Oscillospiraceae bacterium]
MVKGTVFSMIAKIDRVWGISEKRGEASSAREELFYEVKDFILGGSYTKYKNADEVFKYAFLKSTEAEEKTGVDKGAVDMARKRISDQALKIIGEEVFDVLETGDENSVRAYLKNFKNISANFQAKGILPFELIRYINGKSDMSKSFDISDCKRELALLYRLKTTKLTEYADAGNVVVE